MRDYKPIDYQQKKKEYVQLLLKNAFELITTDMFGIISEKIKSAAKEQKMINSEQLEQVRKDFKDKFLDSNKYGKSLARLQDTEMTLSDLMGELVKLDLQFEAFKEESLSNLKLEDVTYESIKDFLIREIANERIDDFE